MATAGKASGDDCVTGDDSLTSLTFSFNLEELVGDDIYKQLKSSFLPKGKGRPPNPPQVILTNRLFLQLQLLKIQGNRSFKDVAVWFEKLFPDVSFPSNRLGGVLSRLMKELTKMHEAKTDLSAFFDKVIDLDFVSPALSELGLKRGQLVDPQNFPVPDIFPVSVTQQMVVDLEKFKSREKLSDSFTLKWIRKMTGCSQSDKNLKASVKTVMAHHKNLIENQGQSRSSSDPACTGIEMLAKFLKMSFTTQKNLLDRCTPQSALSHHLPVPAVSTEAKADSQLKEDISRLQEQVKTLSEANKELNKEKMSLLDEASQYIMEKRKADKLAEKVVQQGKQIKALNPGKLRYLRNTNIKLRDQLRSMRYTERRFQKLKAQYKSLQQTLLTQENSNRRTSRRVKKKLTVLPREKDMLCETVQLQDKSP